MRLITTSLFCCLFWASFIPSLYSQLRLPSFLGSHMVLQQEKTNRIWGWAAPGALVQVQFRQKTYPALSNARGQWEVFLDAAPAGPAGDMVIRSQSSLLRLDDIMLGEVWVCSGQSNMEWTMALLKETYPDELTTASNDRIRFVTIEKAYHTIPQTDAAVSNPWSAISPQTLPKCSAVAYFFAKKLESTLGVPIGLVISSWGGTPAEAWTSFEGLGPFPNYTQAFFEKLHPLDLSQLADQQKQRKIAYEQQLSEQTEYIHQSVAELFDDSQWQQGVLPKSWEQTGFAQVDGVMVYRISFEVSGADAGKAAVVCLPAIDDMDSTYLNGHFIGTKAVWNVPREYTIPAGLLKKGKNSLAVRIQDNGGGGGMNGTPEQFRVVIGKKIIPLAGAATFRLIASMPQAMSSGMAMQNQPTLLYHAMIAPLLPLSLRGAIWYQGESNADRAKEYRSLFPAMIQDWRNRWGQGDFPFLFVQLSSYGALQKDPAESDWAMLREAQAAARSLPNTGMAVSTDVGNPTDIHPKQKKEVGDRLAAEALHQVYLRTDIPSRGPSLRQFHVEGNQLILEFEHTYGGLAVHGTQPLHFAIAGEDRKYYWAVARLEGERIILTAPEVPHPVAARYAWADSPVTANLYNGAGLPAEPFRTDSW